MLAALSRRVSRMFVGLTMVTALSVGLCLAPVLAVSAPAEAVENSSNDVNVNIFPTSGSSVNDGEELAVTVSLVNNSTDTVAAGQIVVTTGSAVISDATTLNNWLAKTDGEQQPGRWLGVIKAPALAAGAHVDLTTTLPLNNALYGSAWGPRGLAADLEVSGESVSSGRGVLIWATASAPSAAKLVTVFPVVSPASTSGLLSADELTLLTSPQGVLTSQLAVAGGRNVTLAVDPRIVASIDALGNGAPASATAWLARLKALPNESFSLAYADADVALQSQAGATQLATANFADQPLIVEPSGVAPTVTPVAPLADLAWAPTLSGFTWPGEDTVVASDMGVLSTNGTQFTLLSSSNVAAGANSPARASIGDQQALITNAGLSRSMRNASSSLNDAQWAANFSLASAYLATTALSPGTQGVGIAALSRDALGEMSQARVAQTLDRLAELSWVDNGTLEAVALSASAPGTSIVDKPESDERVTVAQEILGLNAALAEFSTVLTTPALLTDATTRKELALFSLAWQTSKGWEGAVSGFRQETLATLNSIRIVSSSEIQMVGGQVNIPVTIENTLKLPVTVLVRATPSNARLTVDADATILVPGKAQGKALVPVKARIGNGSVLLSVSLYSPSGVPVGSPISLPVNVRADWESWGLGSLGVLFATLLVVGVVRTVRKRRQDATADADPTADAAVTKHG